MLEGLLLLVQGQKASSDLPHLTRLKQTAEHQTLIKSWNRHTGIMCRISSKISDLCRALSQDTHWPCWDCCMVCLFCTRFSFYFLDLLDHHIFTLCDWHLWLPGESPWLRPCLLDCVNPIISFSCNDCWVKPMALQALHFQKWKKTSCPTHDTIQLLFILLLS